MAQTSRNHRSKRVFSALGLALAAGIYGCAAGQDLGNRGAAAGQPDGGNDSAAETPAPEQDTPDAGASTAKPPATKPTFSFDAQSWTSDDATRRSLSISLGDPQNSKLAAYHDGKSVRIVGENADFTVGFSVYLDVDPVVPAAITKSSFPNYVDGASIHLKLGQSWEKADPSFTIKLTSYSPTHIRGTMSGAMSGIFVSGGVTSLYLDTISGSFDMDVAAAPPAPPP